MAAGRAHIGSTRLPWIPAEQQWRDVLAVAAKEPVRNRVMLALASQLSTSSRSNYTSSSDNCGACDVEQDVHQTGHARVG
jgi:hypothetical protein